MKNLKLVNIVFLVGIFSLFFNHSLPDPQSGAAKIALSNDQMSLIEGKGCSTLAGLGAIAGTIGCVLTWFDPWGCAAAVAADVDCLSPDGSSAPPPNNTPQSPNTNPSKGAPKN